LACLGKDLGCFLLHQPKPQQAAEENAVNLKSRILELPHWFFVSSWVFPSNVKFRRNDDCKIVALENLRAIPNMPSYYSTTVSMIYPG